MIHNITHYRISDNGLLLGGEYLAWMPSKIWEKEQRIFRELLRECRQDAGFKQVELAAKLEQHQSYVSKYETGERRLDLLELRRVCTELGMSTTDFLEKLEARISKK